MHFTNTPTLLLTLLTLATTSRLGLALPTPSSSPSSSISTRNSYPSSITVTFIGAAGAQFVQAIPFTSTFTPIGNALSISHIATSGGPVACFGVDGSVNKFLGAGYADVGPPQTIVGCVAGPIPEGGEH